MHVHGLAEQITQRSLEAKLLNLEQRLHSGLVRIGIGRTVDLQTSSGNLQAVHDGDVQAGQFHAAFEAGGKGFDNAGTQDWFGMGECVTNTDDCGDENEQQDGANPSPAARAACTWHLDDWTGSGGRCGAT